MRMSMRRFTRLTNAFCKKFENHCHSLALYFVWYNWIRNHKTLGVTPAMAAGLIQTPLKFTDLLTAMDADEENQIDGEASGYYRCFGSNHPRHNQTETLPRIAIERVAAAFAIGLVNCVDQARIVHRINGVQPSDKWSRHARRAPRNG